MAIVFHLRHIQQPFFPAVCSLVPLQGSVGQFVPVRPFQRSQGSFEGSTRWAPLQHWEEGLAGRSPHRLLPSTWQRGAGLEPWKTSANYPLNWECETRPVTVQLHKIICGRAAWNPAPEAA